jgi:hypothetical protein
MFRHVVFGTTQLGDDEREAIVREMTRLGGTHTSSIDITCTHLIAGRAVGNSFSSSKSTQQSSKFTNHTLR